MGIKKSHLIKTIVFFAITVALLAAYFFTPLKDYFDIDKIIELAKDFPDSWTVFFSFLAIFAVGGCLLMPIPLATFAISLIFDLEKSLILCILGAMMASSSAYFLGFLLNLDTFGPWVNKHLQKIKKKLDNKGPYAVFALRIAPTPPFTVTSILSGSLKVNYPKYLLASTLGILPLMLLVLFFGKQMMEILQEPSTFGISALIALVILYVIFSINKKKMSD